MGKCRSCWRHLSEMSSPDWPHLNIARQALAAGGQPLFVCRELPGLFKYGVYTGLFHTGDLPMSRWAGLDQSLPQKTCSSVQRDVDSSRILTGDLYDFRNSQFVEIAQDKNFSVMFG